MSDTQSAQRARGYETPRCDVQALVPLSCERILELGCSNGSLGAAIKARQRALVVGVEIDRRFAEVAAERLDRVIVSDVEAFASDSAPPEAPFDCLIAADVLEHLVDPWGALARCVTFLSPGADVVISLPNIVYIRAIFRLLRARSWPRDPEGTFDETHLRWFTRSDALEMLRGAGLQPIRIHPNFFTEGWKLQVAKTLTRTPLREYVAAQYVISARLPVDHGRPPA
ncbi:MAG TPA: methyltransferase domain-containing protein [Solirubrobacteraceae bacterium]|nr:methyltransferase domain-containing protein [Solirubrobacteraceae bacterium]